MLMLTLALSDKHVKCEKKIMQWKVLKLKFDSKDKKTKADLSIHRCWRNFKQVLYTEDKIM